MQTSSLEHNNNKKSSYDTCDINNFSCLLYLTKFYSDYFFWMGILFMFFCMCPSMQSFFDTLSMNKLCSKFSYDFLAQYGC